MNIKLKDGQTTIEEEYADESEKDSSFKRIALTTTKKTTTKYATKHLRIHIVFSILPLCVCVCFFVQIAGTERL